MAISPLVNAQHLAWYGAQLTSAIASSDAWGHATNYRSPCVYRDEAIRLAAEARKLLDAIDAGLSLATGEG